MATNKASCISEYVGSRDNNFNILRMIAASAVLITHSFVLVLGDPRYEPFRESLGITMGSIAVDIFFITSGFLVTGSLYNRGCAIEFIWSRILRIFPALVIMLLITVFIMGSLVTSLPIAEYMRSQQVYSYFARCATLFFGVVYELPGVFSDNPYNSSVNGSLWTMPYEVRMYAILLCFWWTSRLLKSASATMLKITASSFAIACLCATLYFHNGDSSTHRFFALGYMFFIGSVFYIFKDKIVLRSAFAFIGASLMLAASFIDTRVFYVAYVFVIPYILLCLVYIPSGTIRNYNRLGDYSFGVYIYAFPIQQLLVFMIPGISVSEMIAISFAITLIFAVVSWNLIERHALSLKKKYVIKTKMMLNSA